jgi:hypothetical protein
VTVLRNLTRHPVVLVAGDSTLRLPAHPTPPRIADERVRQRTVSTGELTLPLQELRVGAVRDLPPPQPGTLFVVPRVVAAACPERTDLVFPFDELRDADGTVTGCRALARLLPPGC